MALFGFVLLDSIFTVFSSYSFSDMHLRSFNLNRNWLCFFNKAIHHEGLSRTKPREHEGSRRYMKYSITIINNQVFPYHSLYTKYYTLNTNSLSILRPAIQKSGHIPTHSGKISVRRRHLILTTNEHKKPRRDEIVNG